MKINQARLRDIIKEELRGALRAKSILTEDDQFDIASRWLNQVATEMADLTNLTLSSPDISGDTAGGTPSGGMSWESDSFKLSIPEGDDLTGVVKRVSVIADAVDFNKSYWLAWGNLRSDMPAELLDDDESTWAKRPGDKMYLFNATEGQSTKQSAAADLAGEVPIAMGTTSASANDTRPSVSELARVLYTPISNDILGAAPPEDPENLDSLEEPAAQGQQVAAQQPSMTITDPETGEVLGQR